LLDNLFDFFVGLVASADLRLALNSCEELPSQVTLRRFHDPFSAFCLGLCSFLYGVADFIGKDTVTSLLINPSTLLSLETVGSFHFGVKNCIDYLWVTKY
jgi:hypothetical protein